MAVKLLLKFMYCVMFKGFLKGKLMKAGKARAVLLRQKLPQTTLAMFCALEKTK